MAQRPTTLENEMAATLASAASFQNVETAMNREIEKITTDVITAISDVKIAAQQLEDIVLQSVARVKGVLGEHVELASAVKVEVGKLGDTIAMLRDAQQQEGQHHDQPPPVKGAPVVRGPREQGSDRNAHEHAAHDPYAPSHGQRGRADQAANRPIRSAEMETHK
ncbi:MAG TPA: hypothetical protein VM867_08245 [Xanthobacteraceae bacterium]|jgi:predicted Zn-dependent protease with MMP-like domain|nr:hypothetical protein [Xanthobacteraceae bacterium]